MAGCEKSGTKNGNIDSPRVLPCLRRSARSFSSFFASFFSLLFPAFPFFSALFRVFFRRFFAVFSHSKTRNKLRCGPGQSCSVLPCAPVPRRGRSSAHAAVPRVFVPPLGWSFGRFVSFLHGICRRPCFSSFFFSCKLAIRLGSVDLSTSETGRVSFLSCVLFLSFPRFSAFFSRFFAFFSRVFSAFSCVYPM